MVPNYRPSPTEVVTSARPPSMNQSCETKKKGPHIETAHCAARGMRSAVAQIGHW